MSDESVIIVEEEEEEDDEVVVIDQAVDREASADSDVQMVVNVDDDDVVLIGSNPARGRDRDKHRDRSDIRLRSRSRSPMPARHEQTARRGRLSEGWSMEDDSTPTKALYVSGLPPWARKRHLLALAAPFGQPEIVVPRSRDDSRPCRGFGYVSFPTIDEAKRARSSMRHASIDGCPIHVEFARERFP
ncbi:hypothetical protein PRIPAC_78744 [Pristionchus pacificus]|uniref:RNA binding protein n=1 Tax=Pristionchus pacificus TaxID=54126 RepID=A0A2A6BHF7_PRIPA|nr:hypothetical protein PRIPAC_78744 [Pristionchus pacificus]|eukprot:PDM65340.1 RNA binding protein [Pristionchus pacificus]